MGQNKDISEMKIWRHKQASRNKAKPMKQVNKDLFLTVCMIWVIYSYIITGSSCLLKW